MIKATYYTHMGSDDMVCDMARASFGKRSDQYTPEQNRRLIGYLARGMSQADQAKILKEAADSEDYSVLLDCFKRLNAHQHWAPMAHPQVTMFIEVPIFVARQDFKHIVGFVRSETSRRYIDSEPKFYMPQLWRSRPDGSVKQGSGVAHPHSSIVSKMVERTNKQCLLDYNAMIDNGVAPEQARMILPQSMMTTYYTTGSLAAWARAYKQRIDPHAQVEIQQLAAEWDRVIRPLFPVSWAALTE